MTNKINKDYLKPYDMVFTWTNHKNIFLKILAWGISLFTKGGPSHVVLYMGEGKFTEFTYPKSRWGDLDEIDLSTTKVEMGRNTLLQNLNIKDMVKLRRWCENMMGKDYDLKELFIEHLLDELGIDSKDSSKKKKFVCSSYVKNGYKFIEKDMVPDEELASPQDLRESNYYKVIWQSWKK